MKYIDLPNIWPIVLAFTSAKKNVVAQIWKLYGTTKIRFFIAISRWSSYNVVMQIWYTYYSRICIVLHCVIFPVNSFDASSSIMIVKIYIGYVMPFSAKRNIVVNRFEGFSILHKHVCETSSLLWNNVDMQQDLFISLIEIWLCAVYLL